MILTVTGPAVAARSPARGVAQPASASSSAIASFIRIRSSPNPTRMRFAMRQMGCHPPRLSKRDETLQEATDQRRRERDARMIYFEDLEVGAERYFGSYEV